VGNDTLPHLRHLDVGFAYPGDEKVTKGAAVLRVIGNMSWVHTVEIQVGFYLLNSEQCCHMILVREDWIKGPMVNSYAPITNG
jgi:hypothetical protein